MNLSRQKILAASALVAGVGYTLATRLVLRAGRRNSPDLLPTYSPWHIVLEPGEQKHVAVVYNPTKVRALQGCKMVSQQLQDAGWDKAIFYETTAADPGFSMAQDALAHGAELVIAIGGDGTVREVARALAHTEASLGIIPLGTGNLLARNLDIPFDDISACVNIALHGQVQRIDMIHLVAEDARGAAYEHDFLVMGGAGFDAQIMTDTREDLKARFGWIAYIEAGAKNLISPRRSVSIAVDGAPAFGRKVRSVLVANTGTLQGGINLTAVTNAQDGQLEIIVLTPRNLLGWVRLAAQLIARRHILFPVVEHFVGKKAEVSFINHAQPLEIDGDVVGNVKSLQAEVIPAAIGVHLYPAGQERTRKLSDIPQELIESRELIQQQFEQTSDILLRDFAENAEKRRATLQQWLRGKKS